MVGEDFLGKESLQYEAKEPPPDIAALAEHLGIPRLARKIFAPVVFSFESASEVLC